MHKYLPDLEAFNALGGKPFKLEMTLPTYVDPFSNFKYYCSRLTNIYWK